MVTTKVNLEWIEKNLPMFLRKSGRIVDLLSLKYFKGKIKLQENMKYCSMKNDNATLTREYLASGSLKNC